MKGRTCKKSRVEDTNGDPLTLKSIGGIVERGMGNSGELAALALYVGMCMEVGGGGLLWRLSPSYEPEPMWEKKCSRTSFFLFI